ncbi:MAG TPA: DUF3775 domain-containing protein [Tepidisphaeraceae bacterium]
MGSFEQRDLKDLTAVVERAIGLIEVGHGDRGEQSVKPFVTFVAGLPAEMAGGLLAVMYLGRGDHKTLAGVLRALGDTASNDTGVVARQMLAKGPLIKYLRSGLAKLRLDF